MQSIQIVYLFLGILLCLGGWAAYFAGLKILGVILGGTTLAVIGFFIVLMLGITSDSLPTLIILSSAVIGGLIGIYLSTKLHKLLFFLFGAAVGAVGAYLLRPLAIQREFLPENNQIVSILFHLFFVIIGGIVAIFISSYLICFATASIGTICIAIGLRLPSVHPLLIVIWVAAFLFQSSTLTLVKKKSEE